ncbi:hypothetical protein M513_14254, partial [Trichuris suis]
ASSGGQIRDCAIPVSSKHSKVARQRRLGQEAHIGRIHQKTQNSSPRPKDKERENRPWL